MKIIHLLIISACYTVPCFGTNQALGQSEGAISVLVQTGASTSGTMAAGSPGAETSDKTDANNKFLRFGGRFSLPLTTFIGVDLGAFAELGSVEYNINQEKRFGFFWGLASTIGLTDHPFPGRGRDVGISYGFDYFPLARLSVASMSETVVNGNSMERTTLTQYKGGNGQSYHCSVTDIYRGWPLEKGQELTYGLGAEYLIQNFSTKTDEVKVSDSSMTPQSTESIAVNHRLSFFNGMLIFGYKM